MTRTVSTRKERSRASTNKNEDEQQRRCCSDAPFAGEKEEKMNSTRDAAGGDVLANGKHKKRQKSDGKEKTAIEAAELCNLNHRMKSGSRSDWRPA